MCGRRAGDIVVAGAAVGDGTFEQERPERRSCGCDRSVADAVARRVRREDHATVLRLLAKAHLDLGRARSRACCRLHALGRTDRGRDPQRSRDFTGPNAPRRDRTDHGGATAAARTRVRSPRGAPALDARLQTLETADHSRGDRSGTTLTDLYGVGPIIAAIVIGYSGDMSVPDRRALRVLQRDRTDRAQLRRPYRAPAVAAREPHPQPCDPHDRRHPDPQPRKAKAAPTTTRRSRPARPSVKRYVR